MLFNSIEFAFFLPIVFLIYWAIWYAHINENTKLRLQNAFVLIASYVFYGWWDWRFLLLIAFTSFCSWGSGLLIASPPALSRREGANKQRMLSPKFWMVANIVLNLGILAVFKYYDFFVSEFGQLFGISTDSLLLRIILPVGISFYTFQALSYSIDVYRQKIEPTKDIIAFFAFIAFFPQLVAGPIERATNLLPQFLQPQILIRPSDRRNAPNPLGAIQENSGSRQLRNICRSSLGNIRHPNRLYIIACSHSLYVPDLRRLLRLFRYCHRNSQTLWNQTDAQLQQSVFLA